MKSKRFMFFALFLLAGCSSGITVKRVTSDAPVVGNPWNLAMTRFTITITRHIIACGTNINGMVEVIAVPGPVLDEEQRYTLQSDGWWATSDITSTLAPNATSTSLNAQSTDQTATIIANAIGTAGKIALTAAAAAPVAAAPVAPNPAAGDCSDETYNAVNELYPAADGGKPKLKKKVDDSTAALATATAKVNLLQTQLKNDKSLQANLVAAMGDVRRLTDALTQDQNRLAIGIAATTDTQVITWPGSSTIFRTTQSLSIADQVLKKWVRVGANIDSIKKKFDVSLALYRPELKASLWKTPSLPIAIDTSVGVPIRLAQSGRLLICRESACPESVDMYAPTDEALTPFDTVVLQLGQLYTIPLVGGSLKSTTAAIAIDSNGLPTSVQVAEKAAAGASLSAATLDAATQTATLPGLLAKARLDKTQAQTNQVNAQADLLKASATLGSSNAIAGLTAQTALVNAQNALARASAESSVQQTTDQTVQVAVLNAQAALITAQANAGVAEKVGALNAEASLINAEAAKANAAAALVRAQAAN